MNGIQSAVTCQRFFNRGLYFIVTSDVANDAEMIRAKFGHDAFHPVFVNGNNNDFRTSGCICLGAVTPDAARATGEKNNFIFELRLHFKK